MHTSTVTVACIRPDEHANVGYPDHEFRIEWYSGTGAGGQHRNKYQNSCRMTHVPTGMVATAQCRSRENSQAEAKATLLERLKQAHRAKVGGELAQERKQQVGSGMRGDKVRTYREQDGVVTDHRTERKANLKQVEAGKLELLW